MRASRPRPTLRPFRKLCVDFLITQKPPLAGLIATMAVFVILGAASGLPHWYASRAERGRRGGASVVIGTYRNGLASETSKVSRFDRWRGFSGETFEVCL